MTTGIYTTKWFLQCFIERVSIWISSRSSLFFRGVISSPISECLTMLSFTFIFKLELHLWQFYYVLMRLTLKLTDTFHPHPAFMGHLHIGRGEDAICYGLHYPQVTQK